MVHGSAKGDQRAAVMADHGELLVAEVAHERDHVGGHRPLGRLRVLGGIGWQRGPPVSAQIGADDRERVSQPRRQAMPCRVRAGMTVQQHHRRPPAAVANAERHLPHIDELERKAIEHDTLLPRALEM